jgi:hypothetical protein
MKQIKVQRQKSYYGIIRALNIFVDGNHLGNIKQGETKVFEVPEGGCEIWGKMDWGETLHLSLKDYTPDKTVVFAGYFTFNPLKGLGLSKLPFKVFIS